MSILVDGQKKRLGPETMNALVVNAINWRENVGGVKPTAKEICDICSYLYRKEGIRIELSEIYTTLNRLMSYSKRRIKKQEGFREIRGRRRVVTVYSMI